MEKEAGIAQWRSKVVALKDQLKARLRTDQAYGHVRQGSMIGGAAAAAGFRGKTGLVVAARVFKGNIVLARVRTRLGQKELWPWKKKFKVSGMGRRDDLEASTGRTFVEELVSRRRRPNGGIETFKSPFSEESLATRVLRAVAVPVIGNACYIFMHGLNTTEVYGLEKLQEAIRHRPQRQGLLTVSNHVAAMDDPLVTASLLTPQMLMDEKSLRWTLCASDRCFTSRTTAAFFSSVKVLPVSRGEGIHQEGMNMALEKINRGDWVHIFPEGSRSRNGGKTVATAKRGVGRLVVDADEAPLIIPYVHHGMQDVMPIGSKFPHICKRITVIVGDPVPVADLVASRDNGELSNAALYDAIANRVGDRMQVLKQQLDTLVEQRSLELEQEQKAAAAAHRGGLAWRLVDWEMLGYPFYDTAAEQGSRSRPSGSYYSEEAPETNTRAGYRRFDDPKPAFESESSIITRLRSFADPKTFMSFAARGIDLGPA